MNKDVYCNNSYISRIRGKKLIRKKMVKQIVVHPYKDQAEKMAELTRMCQPKKEAHNVCC